MSLESLLSSGLSGERPIRLTATDVASWLRLDQCDRSLRFQLEYRNEVRTADTPGFLAELDVAPQSLPELLSEAGASFEQSVIDQIAQLMRLIDCSTSRSGANDNRRLLDLIRTVRTGERVAVTQPRLNVELAGWSLRGDLDLLIIERSNDGALSLSVLDMKSSSDSRVEHKIQIAIYQAMLKELCRQAEIAIAYLGGGIIYRGTADPATLAPAAREKHDNRIEAAIRFGLQGACLDWVADGALYQDAVDDLILADHSRLRAVAQKGLLSAPYQYTVTCDGCFFNEACLKISSDTDDLTLIPFMTGDARSAFHRAGVQTATALADLMEPGVVTIAGVEREGLVPAQSTEETCHHLMDERAIGGRLDELVGRARKLRSRDPASDPVSNLLPGTGYGSLPFSAVDHDPNLIRIYLDVQRDYLHDRLYLASALIQANELGVRTPERRATVVTMSDGPPDSPDVERTLLIEFISRVLLSVLEVAAPDEEGELKAPIHLVFFERSAMTSLLQALGRHADEVLGATALYDFIAQQPAFDSPLVTIMTEEIRTLKNYPLLAPSLQAVSRYLGFDWDVEKPLTELFRSGHFDDVRPAGGEADSWFTGRARFSSSVPLEYAYAAWEALEPGNDTQASWHAVKRPDVLSLAERRLAAIEAIADDFEGNRRSYKSRFSLPDLALFEERTSDVATGIEAFILTERHVELGAWRQARQPSPEQRMMNGDSLVVRYLSADQTPEMVTANEEHIARQRAWEALRDAWIAAHPDGEKMELSKPERDATRWSNDGTRVTFEVQLPGDRNRAERFLALSDIKIGERVLLGDRWSVDSRLAESEQTSFQTTARQLLYGKRAEVVDIRHVLAQDGFDRTLITLELKPSFGNDPGFMFFARSQTFVDGAVFTIETDPNNIMLSRGRKLALEIQGGLVNAVAERLAEEPMPVAWPDAAADGQARFLDGIDAYVATGHLHDFEIEKRRFIGALGGVETVLVQGPPGTGKSYTTAFAIWARVQGALAAGLPYRVVISCKTHAATDVLIRNVADVQRDLTRLFRLDPDRFEQHFDPALLDVPVFRFKGKTPMQGVRLLFERGHPDMDGQRAMPMILGRQHSITGMTPGGAWSLLGETKDRFASRFSNLLVLDEASQMNLPEALMAGISLEVDGQMVIVGDHRQMPPIVQHDWINEARRSFTRFAAFESLYLAFDRVVPDSQKIKFAESFRLHRDMAEFLRREIYQQDGIPYFSRKTRTIEVPASDDAFVNAVLGPEPLTIIVHDEQSSHTSNQFEERLIARIAAQLADFDPKSGLGVVVTHRAQRANLRQSVPELSLRNGRGEIEFSSVDTVERFQGDERRLILVGLTESDPHFIRLTGEFLLDPRRLTVALSRAKEKMIVVASRSVFSVIANDEEAFANAGLWKQFLHRTCTDVRWEGEIDGFGVQVRVNPPLVRPVDAGRV
jgi:hypothetical protein